MLFRKPLFGKAKEQLALEKAQLSQDWRGASGAEIAAKVKEMVAEQHGIELSTVTDELDFFRDLDDSLDFVKMLMRCEEEFEIEISDEDVGVSSITTVGGLTALVLQSLGHPNSG